MAMAELAGWTVQWPSFCSPPFHRRVGLYKTLRERVHSNCAASPVAQTGADEAPTPSSKRAPCRTATRRKVIIAETVCPAVSRDVSQAKPLARPLSLDPEAAFPATPTSRRRLLLLSAASGVSLALAQLGRQGLALAEDGTEEVRTSAAEAVPVTAESSARGPPQEASSGASTSLPAKQAGVKKVQGTEVLTAKNGLELDDHDRKLLDYNRRVQKLNNAPRDFPGFIREGFDVKVVATQDYVTTPSGLMYLDIYPGKGDPPADGQQVIFQYTGYNESGRRVDSSYQQGRPAETRVGINGMIPGFEEGIKSMRAGGVRRIVIPPELGPPTGPGTFFSAKQYEVFDIELLAVKTCTRRQVLFYSDVVCE